MDELIPKGQQVFTRREIAALLRVHPNTIRNWIESGILTVTLGLPGKDLISRQDLLTFLEKRAQLATNRA